jgi:hypothetical protein
MTSLNIKKLLNQDLRLDGVSGGGLKSCCSKATVMEGDEIGAAIASHNARLEEFFQRAASVVAGEVPLAKIGSELSELHLEPIRLAVSAVGLLKRRGALRGTVLTEWTEFHQKAAAALEAARQKKIEELRVVCSGQLPWGWAETIETALYDREGADFRWKPAILEEDIGVHPDLRPLARADRALRSLLLEAIGFDPVKQ